MIAARLWRAGLIGAAAVLATAPAAAHLPWVGKKRVEHVVIVPPLPAPQLAREARPEPPAAGRAACVDVRHVAGAQVFGDQAVEMTLAGGARWRLYFAQSCPALRFYDGFYYRRAEVGRLCAGRDAVIARSGGECAIASIMPMRRAPRPHR